MGSIRISRLVTAALLAAMVGHRLFTLRAPVGVDAYRASIRTAAERVPQRIGAWVGHDVPVPPRAIRVLAPNVIVSRQYLNVETGLTATLLFVHCNDAHDMVGHFPPRCYGAQGWDLAESRPREWTAGSDLRLGGMEYRFHTDSLENARGERSVVVTNVLFRPGGAVLRDMAALSKSIVGAGGQAAGAAQIQLVFDASVPPDARDRAVESLVAGYRPALDAVLSQLK
jgi:hypothetical protein